MPENNAAPPGGQVGVNIAPPLPISTTATGGTAKISQPSTSGVNKAPAPVLDDSKQRPIALPGAAEIAARNSKPVAATTSEGEGEQKSSTIDDPPKPETMSSAPVDKEASLNAAKEAMKSQGHKNIEHLSAPASRLQSGTATPAEVEEVDKVDQVGTPATTAPAEQSKGLEKEVEEPPATKPTAAAEASQEAAVEGEKAEEETVGTKEVESEAATMPAKGKESASKDVEPIQSSEAEKTQQQEAKVGEEATKSVED